LGDFFQQFGRIGVQLPCFFVREKRPAVAMDFIELIEEFAPELERRFA